MNRSKTVPMKKSSFQPGVDVEVRVTAAEHNIQNLVEDITNEADDDDDDEWEDMFPDHLEDATRNEIEALEKDLEEQQRYIEKTREETNKYIKDQEAIRQKLRKNTAKTQKAYQKLKEGMDKKEAESGRLREEKSELMPLISLYTPVFQKMGIDVNTKTCAEGKPIDPHAKNGGETCTGFDCPLLLAKFKLDKDTSKKVDDVLH